MKLFVVPSASLETDVRQAMLSCCQAVACQALCAARYIVPGITRHHRQAVRTVAEETCH